MDELDGQKLVVFWYGATRTAAAYLAKTATGKTNPAQPLTFRTDPKNSIAPFVDEPSDSRWDVAGRCREGNCKGQALDWVDSVQVKWFAWAAEYPETALFAAK
jgi:hypothetical protein